MHTHTHVYVYVHLHWPTDIHKLQDARLRILAISTATGSRPI